MILQKMILNVWLQQFIITIPGTTNINDSDIRAFSDQYFESCYNEFCENGKWKTRMINRSFLLFRNSAVQMQTTIKDDLWQEYMLIKGMIE